MNTYFNRELSWLEFNKRVLEINHREGTFVGEKAKFISIFFQNLDEFFMVRVGSLWDQSKAKGDLEDISGMTPDRQLAEINKRSKELVATAYRDYQDVKIGLAACGIEILPYASLGAKEKAQADGFFEERIFPLLTFRVSERFREYPLVKNETINILVKLTGEEGSFYGHLQIPENINRLVEINRIKGRTYILLEDLIAGNLEYLFDGYSCGEMVTYRITRNADLDYDEEDVDDLLSKIEKSIKKRKWGQIVRLELTALPGKSMVNYLWKSFKISERETYVYDEALDLSFLDEFLGKKWFSPNLFPALEQREIFPGLSGTALFKAIREKDILCHFPYHDFAGITELIRTAAMDEKVVALKMTLYRVSKKSPILEALAEAAKAGKNVTVLLEVKARFDEENNIAWAKKLEHAGVQVILSPLKLKTHAKLLLIIRKEKEALGGYRKYCHLSTGNYNERTAITYEDLGIFTCHPEIGEDLVKIFHFLSSGKALEGLKQLIVSPTMTREFVLKKIDREIIRSKEGKGGRIRAKMNSLIDREIIDKLYQAAKAGVEIDLIIRGICGLIPRKNLRVKSIVGRFLEHSRIYSFGIAGEEEVYISSMDMMERNFDRRVETLNPVLDQEVKNRLLTLLDLLLKDTVNSYELKIDGSYALVSQGRPFDLHSYLLKDGK